MADNSDTVAIHCESSFRFQQYTIVDVDQGPHYDRGSYKGLGIARHTRSRTALIPDVGTLQDGSKFDSSRDRGSPFVTQIGVGRVIKGWDEGVPQLSVGQKANLICTPDYAYGGFSPSTVVTCRGELN